MKKSRILSKIKSLGSPKDIEKMFLEAQKFIKGHQKEYPKPDVWNGDIYVSYASRTYVFSNRKLIPAKELPTKANVIYLSEVAIEKLADALESDASQPKVLLRQLLQLVNIKRYAELSNLINDGFKTNMTFLEFSKLIRK